jgi:hypothetical protein
MKLFSTLSTPKKSVSGRECSPHISTTPKRNSLKPRLQTQTNRLFLDSIKLTRAFYNSSQSHSLPFTPHSQKRRKFHSQLLRIQEPPTAKLGDERTDDSPSHCNHSPDDTDRCSGWRIALRGHHFKVGRHAAHLSSVWGRVTLLPTFPISVLTSLATLMPPVDAGLRRYGLISEVGYIAALLSHLNPVPLRRALGANLIQFYVSFNCTF